jgi:glutaredoxin
MIDVRNLLITAALWTVLAAACHEDQPPLPEQQVAASSLPAIKVRPQSKLLLTYARPDGSFETVDKLDKVPEGRRGWVRVVDLSVKPEQRRDHELVYVADLRKPGKDGSYPYVVMSRVAFESAAVGRAGQGATDKPSSRPAAAGGARVILYATAWCPACRQARQYMTQKGIPFVEKDIEKDQAAAAELLAKAKAAGISSSGVPVLDVGGTLMQGFSADRLEALLQQQRAGGAAKKNE